MSSAVLHKPGTLVHTRGREWVVLPASTEELLQLRPLGGLDEEIAGVLPAIEKVKSATFSMPHLEDLGDFCSGKLLRDAARLSTRAAAGPFRSFARIAVEPRPYQLVPLMMALQLDPVRMLIADDVGIGKTIEASLIARELLDRGEIQRFAVLCPPHLAEQWQKELAEKFHIDAQLVLSRTIQRLERDLPLGESVFERHPFTVVSTDFIKAQRRAGDFVRKCPECVIVDEAHGCTRAGGAGRGRQQRHELVRSIAADAKRHLILVTATPHSGNEDAFRSLLSLLDSKFKELPKDLDSDKRTHVRKQLARHLVQRRRADIRNYLETDTAFPKRLDKEETYSFHPEYRKLLEDIFAFACEYVSEEEGGKRRKRVRYWSALALLRCVSSSPAAAAATLRRRAAVDQYTDTDVDEEAKRTILDYGDDDTIAVDLSPGTEVEGAAPSSRRKLLDFARRAESFDLSNDHKVQGAINEIKKLLKDDFHPVIFCRFIDTAEYVARCLRKALSKEVRVEAVTGNLDDAVRESRITALAEGGGKFVLVCTDCLSEGINLQEHFDAVLHYDLAWNPTRHEQREGRVDRFGQKKSEVRVLSYYGQDNPIDGVILDVLLRKHKSIKSDLGVTVAVPGSSEQIIETLFEGALFREQASGGTGKQASLDFIESFEPQQEAMHKEWDDARAREKASRSRFAQRPLKPEAVAEELADVRAAIGGAKDVERFVHTVLQAANISLEKRGQALLVHLNNETPRALRQAMGRDDPFTGRFDLPLQESELYLGRTSPIVEGLAGWTLDEALDLRARRDTHKPVAARCGVMATSLVEKRTILVLTRFRFHLKISQRAETLLCEEILPLAFRESVYTPQWLAEEEGEQLLNAKPEGNIPSTGVKQQLNYLLPQLKQLQTALAVLAKERATAQLEAHQRVRNVAGANRRVSSVEAVLPVDILGAYILLPRLP